jgi:hypothetical protein
LMLRHSWAMWSTFFDDDTAAVNAELELLPAMRDPQVRQLATRAAGLSLDTLKTLLGMLGQARQFEGLPTATPSRAAAAAVSRPERQSVRAQSASGTTETSPRVADARGTVIQLATSQT